MRKRNIKRNNTVNTRLFKILFSVAGIIFVLTGILYGIKIGLSHFSSPQVVLANPYLRQNQFYDIDKKLDEKGFTIESQDLSQDKSTLIVNLEKGPKVIFTTSQDIDWQISSLHSIIYTLTIENKQPKQIDFRFGKPIVKF